MLGVQHELVGTIIGLFFAVISYSLGHPIVAIGCFLISIWGANLPDILDPPTNPFHRSIGHNFVTFFMFLITSLLGIALSILLSGNWAIIFIVTTSFSLSVLSHLIMDMMTPMGLPMFFGKSIFGIIQIPLYFIPIINLIMIIITIFMALNTIKYLARRIGGKMALALLLIPLWGTLLLLSMALYSRLMWLSILLIILLVLVTLLIHFLGNLIDNSLRIKMKKYAK